MLLKPHLSHPRQHQVTQASHTYFVVYQKPSFVLHRHNNSKKLVLIEDKILEHQWHSVFCKQMPYQTLEGSTYPSDEFGGKFKNS